VRHAPSPSPLAPRPAPSPSPVCSRWASCGCAAVTGVVEPSQRAVLSTDGADEGWYCSSSRLLSFCDHWSLYKARLRGSLRCCCCSLTLAWHSVYRDLMCTTCGDYKLGKLYTATPKQLVHMQYLLLSLTHTHTHTSASLLSSNVVLSCVCADNSIL
jgi:hypothetical protein